MTERRGAQLGFEGRSAPDTFAPRIGVAILAYEAASTILDVLDGVDAVMGDAASSVLVADDGSSDATYATAQDWAEHREHVEVHRNPRNLGYGGNQKVVFEWALDQQVDLLLVMHGDRQHLPSDVPALLAPLISGDADAVFGSRTLVPGAARKGGMPIHRFAANRALTTIQNHITGARFSEWHSGFRAYRLAAVERVDVAALPDTFTFDCAMTLALLDTGARIVEVPCTTRYADEVSRVQLFRYGVAVIFQPIIHRVRRRSSQRRDASPEPLHR